MKERIELVLHNRHRLRTTRQKSGVISYWLAIVMVAMIGFFCTSLHADGVTGTAFLVSQDGYAVTCAHVVKDATEVRLAIGEKTLKAAIIAVDEKNDIAVLKVEATKLPTLMLSTTSKTEPGARVWVLGFPLTSILGDTVKITGGSMSGVSVQGTQRIIQIDAAVNPGNSGGPLFNDRGEVIGVVNAKIVASDVTGVGFAVPVNYAMQLLRAEGVSLPTGPTGPVLDGPALAKKASPAVVLVTATVPLKEPVLIKSLPVGECLSASFSKDGRSLICAGAMSNKATIWDLETGKVTQSFIGITREDFKPGALDKALEYLLGHPSVTDAVFSPDGKSAACASPPLLMLWDVKSGNRLRTLFGGVLFASFAFSMDGQWFLHGGDGREIKCLSLNTGEETHLDIKSFSDISVSPDSKFAAVCYAPYAATPHREDVIEIMGIPSGTVVKKITGSRAKITTVCYSPDGQHIAGAETDARQEIIGDSVVITSGIVTIWDAKSGAIVRNIPCPGMSPSHLQYSPDGRMLVVQLQEAKNYLANEEISTSVGLYETTTGKRTALLTGFLGFQNSIHSFSSDSKLLAVVGAAHEVVDIWQVK